MKRKSARKQTTRRSSWKAIEQKRSGRRSQQWRWRTMLKPAAIVLAIALLLGTVIGLTGFGIHLGSRVWDQLVDDVPGPSLRYVSVTSDGYLDHHWLETHLELPIGVPLGDVDLNALHGELMSHPQIEEAILRREYPDRIHFTLRERTPILRLQALVDGQRQRFLVASDGVVFTAAEVPSAIQRSLPILRGIRLQRQGDGFAPIPRIAPVANLLRVARTHYPDVYAAMRRVDLRDYTGRENSPVARFRVELNNGTEVLLAPGEDYRRLDRLTLVADLLSNQRPREVPAVIDLTLADQAAIRFVSSTTP